MKWRFKIGTLLEDQGRICIVSALLPMGCETMKLNTKMNWRDNYKLIYTNQTTYIIGAAALHRLVDQGRINLIKIA
tara:strand:+ start:135 stop:362 length:228 start_codon:yes stop_codon:yes gene_type:complete